MPFDQGNITFRICSLPEPMPGDSIERFAEYAARPLEEVKDEPQWGWVSPRHLLDSNISDETIRCAGFYHLCLRQAERKIPSSLLSAECRMIELARMAEKGHERLGRKERKTIKEEVQQRLLPKMPPQISGMHFVIDCTENLLYTSATSASQLDMFLAFFKKSVGFEPPIVLSWTRRAFRRWASRPTPTAPAMRPTAASARTSLLGSGSSRKSAAACCHRRKLASSV
jgi:DNA recombination-dependent growth factor C